MHGYDYSSDDIDGKGTDLPAGVLRSRGGWEDTNNMEMEREREQVRLTGADGAGKSLSKNHAAVDLSQFRNEEVGKGYKAKHVVRQRDATVSAASTSAVVDMTGGKFSKTDIRTKRSDDTQKDNNDGRIAEPVEFHHGDFLESKGIRDFIKELHKILKPSIDETIQSDHTRRE